MKVYLYTSLIILFYLSCRYSSIEIKPELQRNVLKFGYVINNKYEGMLAHSFDRYYVVTKFILPTLDDLRLSPIQYDKDCNYLHDLHDQDNEEIKQNIKDLLLYCSKLRPYMAFYKMQIKACNNTAHHILKNGVDLILPKCNDCCKSKRGIFSAIITGFIGLAFEGISSFLHNRRHKALHKAVKAMSVTRDMQRNKLIHLENTMVMYGIYNVETLENLVKTVNTLHSRQTLYENLFSGRTSSAYESYLQLHGSHGIQHYAVNSMVYLRTIKDKYIEIYNEFISQLCIYAKAVRILAKGFLPISLITPLKLQEIIDFVRESLIKTNPDYDIVINRLHLYYGMKLVTFGIDKKRNLIIQFPIFIQPYTQQPFILYQLETVLVPIVDKNPKADSYNQLQIKKPYLALYLEMYINIRLATCKRIGYKFYCEELFVVRHKSIHSCKSAIYLDLDKELIKWNWDFMFYYNKTDITPTVLNGGNKIILANCPNDKHIIWTINNDIPIEILSHPYILVNRSVLCNCGIEAENNFLLQSLATCHDANTNLIMYFTVNTAFTNYLDQFNLMEELEFLILTNKTTSEYTLPVFL